MVRSPRPWTAARVAALLVGTLALAAACSTTPATPPSLEVGANAIVVHGCQDPVAAAGIPLVRAAADGCPEIAAVLLRCAPRLDPVLAFDGRRDLVVVGGRFAVPVRAVPPEATFVGEVGGARVYREPGLDGRVFVADGAGASRWLALPADGGATAPSAYVVGDSIAEGSSQSLVGALPEWTTTIDAEIGRRTGEALDAVGATAAFDPSAVVVELGTNDVDPAAFARSARSILDALAEERLVVWVAPHAPFDVTEEIRRAIGRLAARTTNVVVADWSAAVPSDALASDGVHLLPERVDEFARFVSSYLRPWRMAVEGEGARSCATTA